MNVMSKGRRGKAKRHARAEALAQMEQPGMTPENAARIRERHKREHRRRMAAGERHLWSV